MPNVDRITALIAGTGAVLVAICFLAFGVSMGLGAGVGALVAVAHFAATRWLGKRILATRGMRRAGLTILLALKFSALIAVCWFAMKTLDVNPLGFVTGWTALAIGVALGVLIPSPESQDDYLAEESHG